MGQSKQGTLIEQDDLVQSPPNHVSLVTRGVETNEWTH
jgi:hypothetical protein